MRALVHALAYRKQFCTIQARTAELLRWVSSSSVMLLPAPWPASWRACKQSTHNCKQGQDDYYVLLTGTANCQEHTYVWALGQLSLQHILLLQNANFLISSLLRGARSANQD